MNELEYLNIIVNQITTKFPQPSQEYIIFLQKVLSLGNREIENDLKNCPVIPNESLTRFVKAETLYDKSARGIIDDPDVFLRSEFQNDSACLKALYRMGLKKYDSNSSDNSDTDSEQSSSGTSDSDEPYIPQNEELISSLLKILSQPENIYHDVIFIVGEEKKEFRANRYVLSASSNKFGKFLSNNANNPIEIEFQQESFDIFLKLLYGKSFEDAITILRKPSDFKTEQKFILSLIDLLKLTVTYEVNSLRSEVEKAIIKCKCIRVQNLCKIVECLERYDKRKRLRKYYKKHIKSNESLINQQLSELHSNADKNQKLEISRMSRLLSPFCKIQINE
ncbi:hypothetical protein C1645_736421 [Glomus cerebriforme]|uniref:BTB domain-containing protein n=1 Tax=Glomus cerebriforme TaxID=658196 RepID=A0A397T2D5_9GLOM|nr:hypothetical protein C1645_736421 [Glomus cerebriforme]